MRRLRGGLCCRSKGDALPSRRLSGGTQHSPSSVWMLGHLAQLGAACGGTARDGLSVLQGDSWPTQALLAVTWQVHECAHPNVNTVVNMAPVCECADPREHVCMRACVSLRLCVCVSVRS